MRAFISCVVAIIFVAGFWLAAGADDFEYKEYTVQKNDTLWDISQQELEDPFNWPIVWDVNPQLENPDRIYPGQVIRIPINLLKKPKVVPEVTKQMPGEKAAAPPAVGQEGPAGTPIAISTDILEVSADDIRASGYISMDVPRDGVVDRTPVGKTLISVDDEIFLKRIVEKDEVPKPFNVGDRFYVVRDSGEVVHPETEEVMGSVIRILGIAKVVRIGESEVTAIIEELYDQINKGDMLDDYYEVEPFFLTGESRKPEVEGYVVATEHMRFLSSDLNIAYIDKGKNAGIKPGDIIASLEQGSPDRKNGTLRVILTRDETSTTIIVDSAAEVVVGDGLASCAKVLGCPSVE